MVEMVALIACGLCIIFGGVSAGKDWHQHIRKVCHLTRWAFRGFHSSWIPRRALPFGLAKDANENEITAEGEIPVQPQPSKTDSEVIFEETVGKDKEGNYA